MLPQLEEFWDLLQSKLSDEDLYTISIGGMRLRLHELQTEDKQARKTKTEHSEGWDNIDRVLHYQGLSYIPEIIRTKLISRHHDNLLASHFSIKSS